MSECNDCPQTERQGDTYTDGNGRLRVVVFQVCQNPFCPNFHQRRCKVEGDDMPTRMFRMPPAHYKGVKP
jgi:hypothetical protein